MMTRTCQCSQELSFADYTPGSVARCPACETPFMVPPSELQDAIEGDASPDGTQVHESEEEFSEDEPQFPFNFTDFIIVLFIAGLPGLVAGYTAGVFCAGIAILVNVVHNLLPRFIFVVPLVIVGYMAFIPLFFAMGVGTGVGYTAYFLKARNGGTAMFAGMVWTVIGFAIFPWISALGLPPNTEFFDDILMPFVNLMIGAAVHFEWLIQPKPADISPSIVRTVLWVTGIIGVLAAGSRAMDVVEDKDDGEEPLVDLF